MMLFRHRALAGGVLLFLVTFACAAFGGCPPFDRLGLPGQADRILCRSGFVIGYDTRGRIPLWVIMRMTAESTSPYLPRLKHFSPDPDLPPSLQARDRDYVRSGYDRGHLAPAASVDFSHKALAESFQFTNIAPQVPGLNRHAWKALEKHIRSLAYRIGPLYAVAGTYDDPAKPNRWLHNRVRVPDGFYYAIFSVRTRRAVAFLMPNAPIPDQSYRRYRISVDALEAKTGLDFFNRLKDDIEIPAESNSRPLASYTLK